jgi:hypothetical protein
MTYPRCIAPGCKNIATPSGPTRTPRKYCSPKCNGDANRARAKAARKQMTREERDVENMIARLRRAG